MNLSTAWSQRCGRVSLTHKLIALAALLLATPAQAGELIAGVYDHEIDTPWTNGQEIGESAANIQAGYRFGPVESTFGTQPYVLASVNTEGGTNYVAAGLSWKWGTKLYLRPGIGLAIHDGQDGTHRTGDLGSRVLFVPELAAGVQISERASIELSYVHLSHAWLFGDRNPGIDMVGLRISFR